MLVIDLKIINSYINNNLIVDNSKKLNEGLIIRAKIIETNGEFITMSLGNGETIEAKSSINLEGLKNKFMTFLIKGFEDNKVLLTPLGLVEKETVNDQPGSFIDKVLDEYNLPKNQENKEIIKNALNFNISLSKENIVRLVKSVDKINSFRNIQQGERVITFNSEKSPFSEDILKLIKINHNEVMPKNTSNSNLLQKDFKVSEDLLDFTSLNSEISEISEIREISKMNFIDVTEPVTFKLQSLFPSNTTSENIITKIVFLMHLGYKVSIDNIEKLTDLLISEKGVSKHLSDFLELIKLSSEDYDDYNNYAKSDYNLKDIGKSNQSPFEILKLKSANEFNRENVIKYLNGISEILKDISFSSSKKKSNFREIEVKLDNLFSDLKIQDKINYQFPFISLPININDRQDNSSITIYKKKNKSNKSTYVFYISLNTENFQKVDILCTISKNKISLDFAVKEEFLKYFKVKTKNLEKALEELGYEIISLSFKEYEESNILNMFKDDDICLNYNLNIWV